MKAIEVPIPMYYQVSVRYPMLPSFLIFKINQEVFHFSSTEYYASIFFLRNCA